MGGPMLVTAMTVIADPTGLFAPGDVYEAEDIHAWLADDALPEGLRLRNGREYRVEMGALVPVVDRAGGLPGRVLNKTRWRVLLALHDALEAGEPPTYRELAAMVDRALGAIGWHMRKLEEAGLLVRSYYGHRSLRLTELGEAKARALRGGD